MALHPELGLRRTRPAVVIFGGIVYSIVVLSWLFSSGVSISGRGLVAVVALGYA